MAENVRIDFGTYIFDNRNKNIRKRPIYSYNRISTIQNLLNFNLCKRLTNDDYYNGKTIGETDFKYKTLVDDNIREYRSSLKDYEDIDLQYHDLLYNIDINYEDMAYSYSSRYAQKLFYGGKREEAIAYLEQFHFKDIKEQERHKNMIYNLQRSSKQLESLASRTTDQLTKDALFFKDASTLDGGIDFLPSSNSYGNMYKHLMDDILYNDTTKKEGSKFRIRFDNKFNGEINLQNVIFPNLKFDVGEVNNSYNFESWLNRANLNKDILRNAGISVWQKGDSWYLDFDASNSLTKDILGTVFDVPMGISWSLLPTVSILDDNGTVIKEAGGYTPHTNPFNELTKNLIQMKDLRSEINTKVKQLTDSVNTSDDENAEYISTTVGPLLYNVQGKYKDIEDWNKQTKAYQEILARQIQSFDVNTFKEGLWYSYSNINEDKNAEDNSNALKLAGAFEKEQVLAMLKSVDPSDLTFNSMMMDGKIGSLITVQFGKYDSDTEKKMLKADELEDIKARPTLSVFIPGLYAEDASAAFGDDSTIEAYKELNSLKSYKYPYEAENGEVYSCRSDGTGGYVFTTSNGETVDESTVLREMNKDKIIDQAYDALLPEHINANGEFVNFDSFDADLKNIAVKAAADIWGKELTHDDGSPIDYTNGDDIQKFFMEVFAKRNPDGTINEDAMRSVNYNKYLMYKDIIDIYNAIMRGASYYTKYN